MNYSRDCAFWLKYGEWIHVYPVKSSGAVFPRDPQDEELDSTGSIARVHTNGDMFTWIDGKWIRVNLDRVVFVERKSY